MSHVVQQLAETLQSLDEVKAKALEHLVLEAMASVKPRPYTTPEGYLTPEFFESTAGVFANEHFERPPQGDYSVRDEW